MLKVYLPLFLLIYMFLFLCLPAILNSQHKHTFFNQTNNKQKLNFLPLVFLYLVFCIMLTLSKVSIESKYIFFNFCYPIKLLSPTISLSFTAYNFIINLALAFPVGVFVCLLSNRNTISKLSISFFLGTLLATIIESLQATIFTFRVVDICDILFCGLGASIATLLYHFYSF